MGAAPGTSMYVLPPAWGEDLPEDGPPGGRLRSVDTSANLAKSVSVSARRADLRDSSSRTSSRRFFTSPAMVPGWGSGGRRCEVSNWREYKLKYRNGGYKYGKQT